MNKKPYKAAFSNLTLVMVNKSYIYAKPICF